MCVSSPTVRLTLLFSGAGRAETEARQSTRVLFTALTVRLVVTVKRLPTISTELQLDSLCCFCFTFTQEKKRKEISFTVYSDTNLSLRFFLIGGKLQRKVKILFTCQFQMRFSFRDKLKSNGGGDPTPVLERSVQNLK